MSRVFKKVIKEFCLNTCIHGFRFTALPKRSFSERILWLLLTLSLTFIAYLVLYIFWVNAQARQTITLSDSPNLPIWNYQFPTVTVCSFNKFSKNKTYTIAQQLAKSTNLTVDKLALDLRVMLYSLTDLIFPPIPKKEFIDLQLILNNNNISIEYLLHYLAPNCGEMMEKCWWKGQPRLCTDLFEQIKTPHGLCCSFNYYAIKNHSIGGINSNAALKSAIYPRRVTATGFQTGIEALINCFPEDYFATPFSSYGHRILIHSPLNYPDGNVESMLHSTDGILFVGITPSLYRIDANVYNLAISDRKCLLEHERELINFKYTYFNCISECRTNITIKLCNCIPYQFYYAEKNEFYGNPRVCNLMDAFCLSTNSGKIEQLLLGYTENFFGTLEDWVNIHNRCGCLPDCTYYKYEVEGSSSRLYRSLATKRPSLLGKREIRNQSILRLYFEDLVAKRYTTSVKYFWHTKLGLFGGIISLLTGCSIVSVIEFIYMFTVRLLILYFLLKKKNKNTSANGSKTNASTT